MSSANNPQAEQMGDESMVRTLAFQAQAIWPQEAPLFDRYGLKANARILDLGCGTGEISQRIAARFPRAQVTAVDILPANVARAESMSQLQGRPGGPIDYQVGDAFELAFPAASFDLVVCRHMSQAVPDFGQVLAQIRNVLKPGGNLHLLSEDYGMIHLPKHPRELDRFFAEQPIAFLDGTGCDGRVGRHTPMLLERAGFELRALDYIVVDTIRVPRPIFAGILKAWRDGYVPPLAEWTGRSPAEVRADFDAIIELIETPPNYAVWQVPVAWASRPGA